MFFATWVSTFLLASAAFAAPEGQVRRTRRAAGRQTKPFQRIQITGLGDASAASNVSHVEYSSNWAGAVLEYPAGTFYKVTGTIAVPTPSPPDGYASAWVGIDGFTCQTAIFQTGIDFNLVMVSSLTMVAWYEWFPDYAYYFNGITINSGDVVQLNVTASSTTTGTAAIRNLSNGQTASHDLSYPEYPLCEQDAEWIIEDFSSGGGLVPLCDFGTVTFTNANAYTNDGRILAPCGATELDIEQGSVLTSVSESSSCAVTVQYV
ncbi:Peptidase A4 family domain containing protein [Amanita muscaria]